MPGIEALLRRMSLAEKLGQMTMSASRYAVTGPTVVGDSVESIRNGTLGNLLNMVGADHVREVQRIAVEESRLGIPLLIGFDVLHGHRTAFPIPLGEAALFDPRAWALTAREGAREAAADGIALTFAPMLDVSRDPRWGRGAEGPGEDPWLAARFAEAKVRGFQGIDLASPESLAATAKHFCAYGAVTAGRDYAPVDISDRTVHETYLPPFAAAVTAGVAAVMPAFTDLAGVPMTAHTALLRGWLRERRGFDGLIVSDYNAIAELVTQGVAADLPHAAMLALHAGVDVDMMADAYRHGLPIALERGWVTLEQIDASVRRVLRLKQRLGLFENPYARGATPESPAARAARRDLARAVGARAIVMLKNEASALPLAPGLRRVAVVGPLADAAAEMRGPWAGIAEPDDQVTVLAALRERLGASRVVHAGGVGIDDDDGHGIAAAVEACRDADAIVLCVGEAATMSGEAASRAQLGLPGRQREMTEAVFEVAARLAKPTIVVLFSGRALVVPWLVGRCDALLAAWFLGAEAGNAVADVLLGRVSPSGRTPVSWPRAVGQIPLSLGQRQSGRPADPDQRYTSKYLDAPADAEFPFGHGLTYGRFVYGDLRVPELPVGARDTAAIRVELRNEAGQQAEETVFLFIHRRQSHFVPRLLELKGVGKISLAPGESGVVTLLLTGADLYCLDSNFEPRFETGTIDVFVGPSADRTRLLRAAIQLK